MARTQRNKATAHHLGLLKARLAKLRRELITPKGGSGGAAGEGKIIIFRYFEHLSAVMKVSLHRLYSLKHFVLFKTS